MDFKFTDFSNCRNRKDSRCRASMQSTLPIGQDKMGSWAGMFRTPAMTPSDSSFRPSWNCSSESVVPVVARRVLLFQAQASCIRLRPNFSSPDFS